MSLRHYAYPNDVVGVPIVAHQRYLARLVNAGVDRQASETQLFDWYDSVCRQWRGRRIGDRELTFWDKRFEEWQGVTASTSTTSASSGLVNAAYVARRRAGVI